MPRLLRAWSARLREGRHPEQYPHLSREAVRWVLAHRALGPGYLVRYARLLRLRLLHPDVVTHGMVFLGRGVRVETDPGYGRMHLGAFVHVGDRCVLRAHEGTLRVRDKVVMGSDVRVTCWTDVDLGEGTLLADWCYVADFDHVHDDVDRPVKDQGIRKGAVRVGPGSWLGLRSSVLRGSDLGRGTVVAAHAVVKGRHPDDVVLGGVPAVVLVDRAARAAAAASGAPVPQGTPGPSRRRPLRPRRAGRPRPRRLR
ncbi:acyltransferase [Aquipuribacter hungaricus]|uniref:Acyltransferase n=1 Tax=Aquipuribacter hungaricus TaxID=545624 RepID=A0ABV7WH41_9MICO